MTLSASQWLWPLLTYVVGSIPAGYLLGRARGIDIRQHGSGNIGATNVYRVMGRPWGLSIFAFDFLKGFLPLYLIRLYALPPADAWPVSALLVTCAFTAILGHNYTPWLGFKGGKGVATSAGVLGALMPLVLAIALSLWVVAVLVTRYVSVASLLAAVVLPIAAATFYPGQWINFCLASAAGGLAAWRHRSNIRRLLDRTESRIGSSSSKKANP